MRSLLLIGKALSDENRVKALTALSDGELCLCELVELLGIAPSTTSKHIEILRNADLVASRREGRWTFVRLNDTSKSEVVRSALSWLRKSLEADEIACEVRQKAQMRKCNRSSSCSS